MDTASPRSVPASPALSLELQRKRESNLKRSKELWGILRNSVKFSTDLMKKVDILPSTVTHGIHHERKVNHDEPLRCVIYNTLSEEIITVDSQFIRVFYKDGRRKDIIDPGEQILKMIWSPKTDQYIALISDHEMKLLNSNLEFISTATAQYKITCMAYNESFDEVVTVGPGNAVSWCFRYGNKYLIPHKVVTEGLTSQDVFDNISLEGSASKTQKCYVTCGTSVAVLNLHHGCLLDYKKDLHVRNITSILFINPLKYIVTGSRDGSIKLWDESFEIKHVFVGHHGPVESLALYPLGPYFMSGSYDCTVRLWSLETYDEVDLLKTDEPVCGMKTTRNVGNLFSHSVYTVDLWKIGHIHQIFTSVRSEVPSIKMIAFPKIPARIICHSEDNTVRIISPINGSILTSLPSFWSFLSNRDSTSNIDMSKVTLVDAVYCTARENIFAAYSDGSLVKAWSFTNPATIKSIWKFGRADLINCMCLYEYVLDINQLLNTWKESKEVEKMPKRPFNNNVVKYGNKTLLLVGRKDGCIANVDITNGKIIYKTEAHGMKGVISLLSNVKNDQLISAGQDNVVKVWRVFPNTIEAFGLLMSFYCAHTPCHMSIAMSRLVVAFQQPSTATYNIVTYDITTKERFDHTPDQDHTDDITGLACCPRLKIFASSSRDGTIKIWNQSNMLVRTLKLNAEPESIEFCSEKGDLLVGLGGNIHRIEHENYLPQSYLFKMVCMEFSEQTNEDPIKLDENRMRDLMPDMARSIKEAKSSFVKFNYEWDPMTAEEITKMSEDDRERVGVYGSLAARENELNGILKGLVKPKRRLRRTTKRTESVAFRKYMELFWRRPKKMNIPDQDDFSPDLEPERIITPDEWNEEKKTGFFPPISAAKPMKEIMESDKEEKKINYYESGPDYEPKTKYALNPTGFIPNSILTRFVWLQEDVAKQKEENIYKPPQLSEEQMALLSTKKKVRIDEPPAFEFSLATPSDEGSFWEDEEKVLDFGDEILEPSAGAHPEEKAGSPGRAIDRKPSKLMEKLRDAMKTPPPKSPSPEPPQTPPPSQAPPTKQVVKFKPPAKPSKPIVKFVSKPPPSKTPTPPSATPPPPAVRTPTPPPTPTPNFMSQFESTPWFERYRDYIMQRMKRPFEASQFIKVISDVMGISSDWDVRRSVCDSMLLLWQQEDIKDTRHMITAVTLVFNSASNPPSPKDADQAAFLRSALKLYQALQGNTDEFILEILTEYIEGEAGHKNFIKNILIQTGLRDTHNYLGKELESWEVWNLNEPTPLRHQIKEMARRWLKEWTEKFKVHLEQIMEQLKKGDVKANIRKTPGTPQSVLKSSGSPRKQETPRVHFTIQATEQTLRNLTAIEVINYFCEMELEQELEGVRLANAKPEPAKNTVLVLPKLGGPQALVRIGEMHTAHRARVRQQLAVEYKLNPLNRPYPDLMAGFASKIVLPLNTMHMNPFPSPIDKFEMEQLYQPVLLTLSCVHQKYFVPERSYVHLS